MAKKSNAGRKTSFKKEYIEQAVKLCKKGFIDIELADFFNVSKATINNWKKEYPEFLDSLKKGKNFFIIAIGKKVFLNKLYMHIKQFLSTKPYSKNNQEFLEKKFKISKKQLDIVVSKNPLEDLLTEQAAILA